MDTKRIKEIAIDLIKSNGAEAFKQVKGCSDEELYAFHHTLGRYIRNHYGLWRHQHTPQIVDGVDVSPDHPDSISYEIMKELRNQLGA